MSSVNYYSASIKYNGEKVILNPKEMAFENGCFYKDIDGVRVSLKIESMAEYSLQTIYFENIGKENSGRITDVRTMDLNIPAKNTAHLSTLTGDDCSARSFNTVEEDITAPKTVFPAGGRSSSITGFPYFDITADGITYLVGIGWTGQWIYTLTPIKNAVNISVGLQYADFYLKPGERVRGAAVFIMAGIGVDATRQAFKRIEYRDFNALAGTDYKTLPYAIQPFDRYFKKGFGWETEEGQLKSVQDAKKCKYLDTVWLDAAWFREGFPHGVGNYNFEKGFPRGLKPISDAAHKEGMKFMVWFEPERVYEGSDVFKYQSKYLIKAENPDSHVFNLSDENTRLFNLADDEAREWLHNTLKNFIAENGVDIYRQDFNFEPLNYWLSNDEEGRQGITEMKYVAGLYKLWDDLKSDFPDMIFDNCSSGGRRLDFEMNKRGVPMWRSDTNCFAVRDDWHSFTFNQMHAMALSRYLPYHAACIWEPDVYRMRSAAALGLACAFDIMNPEFDHERAAKVLEDVKSKAHYWYLDFYAMTEITADESDFAAYRFERDGIGCAYIFRRDNCENNTYKLVIDTLEEGAYTLKISDNDLRITEKTVTAAELKKGIDIVIDALPGSAIVEYAKN